MGKRPGGAPAGRAPDRRRIQQVIAVEAVITDDIVTQALQMSRYRGTHVTAIPRDQNPHDPMIPNRPTVTAAPTNFAHKKEQQQRAGRGVRRADLRCQALTISTSAAAKPGSPTSRTFAI
jgi:hypothetical protein